MQRLSISLAIAAILLGNPIAPERTAQAGDVRQFGAVGDGTADDTAAIQKAVDSSAGDVQFPRGRYLLTKPIVIDLDRVGYTSISGNGTAQVIMAGPGPAFRFVGTHEGSASPATFKDNVWKTSAHRWSTGSRSSAPTRKRWGSKPPEPCS